jgi:hypothetical protein
VFQNEPFHSTFHFDKIRENLLDLDPDLADMILKVEMRVGLLNRTFIEEKAPLSNLPRNSKVGYEEVSANLRTNTNVNEAVSECVRLLADTSVKARRELFAGKGKLVVDWNPVDKKIREIDKLLMDTLGISKQEQVSK